MDYASQQRNPARHAMGLGFVVLLHLLLGWALISGLAQRLVEVVKSPIETRIIEETKQLPPPPDQLPPPPSKIMPPPSFMPPPEVQTAPPPPPIAPPPPAPAPLPPPPPQAVQQATITPEPVRPPPPPPPPRSSATARSPEDLYVAELRAYLESIKRYPTSREARQLRPQGTVRVWLEVDRAGQLVGAGVEGTSGSLLLDNEALRSVRNGRFPPIPPDAFAGQASRRFVVPIEYLAAGN